MASSSVPRRPVTLTIGYPQATGRDPRFGIQQVARFLSLEGLTVAGRDGRPQPRLAERWLESPDGLTWTFNLRPNVTLHDGSPFDAAGVKAFLDGVLAADDLNVGPGLLDISGIEATGPLELTIRLKQRSAFLLDDLDVDVLKVADGRLIGTGPFRITASSSGRIEMEPYAAYYGPRATIDRIVLRSYPTLRAAWANMMRGDIDFLYEVGQETVEFVRGESSVQVFPFLRFYMYTILFNTSVPLLKDAELRRALSYSIDRQELIDLAFKGRGIVARDPFWPRHWSYTGRPLNDSLDRARALELLNSRAGSGTMRNVRPANVRFTCLIPENFSVHERIALLVQRQLSKIGVDMQIESAPVETFQRRFNAGQFEVALIDMLADRPSRQYRTWHSPGPGADWNFSRYQSAEADAALDALRRAPDDAAYRAAVERFARALENDPPAIFLAWSETARAVSRRFEVPSEPGRDILKSIALWRPAALANSAPAH